MRELYGKIIDNQYYKILKYAYSHNSMTIVFKYQNQIIIFRLKEINAGTINNIDNNNANHNQDTIHHNFLMKRIDIHLSYLG